MMSKKKWFVLLSFYVVYLLLGASIFQTIESQEELVRIVAEHKAQKKIEELIKKMNITHYPESVLFFDNLSKYCGKPLNANMSELEGTRVWDFYHSLFFVITVVSTIGYGNLAPTTMFSRIFMIFYGLIGIPMNGIIMLTLGGFFGRTFTKLYQRWKSSKMESDTKRLSLISQIILYAVPGATFFIFLPAAIMVIFEGWDYDVAVYYTFVTLTTIGFGDYVSGNENPNNLPDIYYKIYQIFLLIWIIGGLGYLVMIIGFITQAMQSKKMKYLEHVITHNIKKTPVKIKQELRLLLDEFLFMRLKPDEEVFPYVPTSIDRRQSCPVLGISESSPCINQKRTFSDKQKQYSYRFQSNDNMQQMNIGNTFSYDNIFMKQQEILKKVVDVLDKLDDNDIDKDNDELADDEIPLHRRYNTDWSHRSLRTSPAPVSISKLCRSSSVTDVKETSIYRIKSKSNWHKHSENQVSKIDQNTFIPKETFLMPHHNHI